MGKICDQLKIKLKWKICKQKQQKVVNLTKLKWKKKVAKLI